MRISSIGKWWNSGRNHRKDYLMKISRLVVFTLVLSSNPFIASYSSNAASRDDFLSVQPEKIQTCFNVETGKHVWLKSRFCNYPNQVVVSWALSDNKNEESKTVLSADTLAADAGILTICSFFGPESRLIMIIRNKCTSHQGTFNYVRDLVRPTIPVVRSAVCIDGELTLKLDSRTESMWKSLTGFEIKIQSETPIFVPRSRNRGILQLQIPRTLTAGSIRVAAISIDGRSEFSGATTDDIAAGNSFSKCSERPKIDIGGNAVQVSSSGGSTNPPSLNNAVPVFTLSSDSLTLTYPYTYSFSIDKGNSEITRFAISYLPSGLSFNTSTGQISGTPWVSSTIETTTVITGFNQNQSFSASLRITAHPYPWSPGEIGPGGGVIAYLTRSGFTCGRNLEKTCRYIEYAPFNWSGGGIEPISSWTESISALNAPLSNPARVGAGWTNTIALAQILGESATPATLALNYRGGGLDDWHLPTYGDLNLIMRFAFSSNYRGGGSGPYQNEFPLIPVGSLVGAPRLGEFSPNLYWTSTPCESFVSCAALENPWIGQFDESRMIHADSTNGLVYVRPIRTF